MKHLYVVPYISGTIYHMIFIYVAHVKKVNISKHFFKFFKNFDFRDHWVGGGVKRQEMSQNDKKFCRSHSVSQEPYII